ncbi:hypothetical protein CLONEX_00601 [[Clostridium] nexile DSM 1787]|nr:hypothetical protein CLONEX_00601 [[Clostridium] nexile DSM 1787]
MPAKLAWLDVLRPPPHLDHSGGVAVLPTISSFSVYLYPTPLTVTI